MSDRMTSNSGFKTVSVRALASGCTLGARRVGKRTRFSRRKNTTSRKRKMTLRIGDHESLSNDARGGVQNNLRRCRGAVCTTVSMSGCGVWCGFALTVGVRTDM